MKKHKRHLREEKKCLNCGACVEGKYCPDCGQENRESRESFLDLIFRFVSTIINFDSKFWKTTRYLLFSPAKLSLEYMEGKRNSYVNPVQLYLFISFLAFFIPAILPTPPGGKFKKQQNVVNPVLGDDFAKELEKHRAIASEIRMDSVYDLANEDQSDNWVLNIIQNGRYNVEGYGIITSSAQIDSIYRNKASYEQITYFKYLTCRSLFKLKENTQNDRNQEKIIEFLIQNIPKALFVYMPVFAFWMWVFFIKRRRYYFDSGIFTLHFFSFVLLLITINNIVTCVFDDWLGLSFFRVLFPVGVIYVTYYFYKANRVFYGGKKNMTKFKSTALFFIHNFFILVVLIGYLLFAVIKDYN